MKPHDHENLNDFECWHVEHFAAQYHELGWRLHGDATAFSVARARAATRYPLEGEEVARVDEYIATRFGVPKVTREPKGLPVPTMVVQ